MTCLERAPRPIDQPPETLVGHLFGSQLTWWCEGRLGTLLRFGCGCWAEWYPTIGGVTWRKPCERHRERLAA